MTAGIYHDKRALDGIHVQFQKELESIGYNIAQYVAIVISLKFCYLNLKKRCVFLRTRHIVKTSIIKRTCILCKRKFKTWLNVT